ncbi:hypothetical protein NGUA18_00401 [Salmonella enterica]|nr:hypothetical protein NGUA18_00401 [Salmonella enterica]
MDIEHTRNNITVVISSIAAGQFQFISAEYFGIKLTNIHIQHTTVSYSNGIGIQIGISAPSSRFGQTNSTIGVNCQVIGVNITIFTNVQ